MFRSRSTSVIATSLVTLAIRAVGVVLFVITTPIYYAYLGVGLFGAYQYAMRLSLFGGLTSLGATSYLKIRLAALAKGADDVARRRAIGESVQQSAASLPVLAGFLFMAYQLVVGDLSLDLADAIAIALILAIAPMTQLLGIPRLALFCEGLGYRGSGSAVLASGIGAGLGLAAVYADLGLLGIAIGLLLGHVVGAMRGLQLARRNLPWFGLEWSSLRACLSNATSSLGVTMASLAYLGMQLIEVVGFGAVDGAAKVGQAIVSATLVTLFELGVRSFVSSAVPALAPLIAMGDNQRVANLRRQVHGQILMAYALVAIPIVLVSGPLVSVWVAESAFVSTVFVAVALTVSMLRVLGLFDSLLLDQRREFGAKFLLAIGSATVAATLIWLAIGISWLQAHWYIMFVPALLLYFVGGAILVARSMRIQAVEDLPMLVIALLVAVLAAGLAEIVEARNLTASEQVVVGVAGGVVVLLLAGWRPNSRQVLMVCVARIMRLVAELRQRPRG